MDLPMVSILLPVLDESSHIDEVMSDLTSQGYEGGLEIIVADGGSTDGTLEKLEVWRKSDPRVSIVDNPQRRQAFGMNRAARASSGEILIRADGHTRYDPTYVEQSVAALLDLEGAVGGPMIPVGSGPFGDAVAAAMRSPLTMGPARFHHSTTREEVDTVYLGAFRRDAYLELGGIRPFPSGSSEDADFYFRWRRSGRKVYVDPGIVSSYSPRETVGELWRQYWRYGQGKSEMLWVNGRLPSWRPLAPTFLVLALLVAAVVALLGGPWVPLVTILAAWALVLLVVALRGEAQPLLVMLAGGVMHLSYGLGAIKGLLTGPPRPARSG